MAKQVLFDHDGEQKLLDGMETLADCVRITFGPSGKHAIYEDEFEDAPTVSGAGSSISSQIELEDPFENMGVSLLNEIAKDSGDDIGDGSALGILLGEEMYREGIPFLRSNVNATELRNGMKKATRAAISAIEDLAEECDDQETLKQVATSAAGGREDFGKIVARAVHEVGIEGSVSVEEGKTIETTLDFVDGLNFDKGYLSPHFCTDREKKIAQLDDAYVLIHHKKINAVKPLVNLLEKVARSGKPLLIIAEDVEGDALTALVLNRLRGTLSSCAVKAPAFGDRRKAMLEDIATLTGATVVSEDSGVELENMTLEDLGQAQRIHVSEDQTVITGGKGSDDQLNKRIQQVRNRIDQASSEYDREKLEERLAKLKGSVAVIRAGGTSEREISDNKQMLDDAVSSSQHALENGVVPGGGVAFIRAKNAVKELSYDEQGEEYGGKIVEKALEVPLRQLAENAGSAGSVVVDEVSESDGFTGFNAKTGEIEDLREAGVLDATPVITGALENASSMVRTVLTSRSFLTDLEDDEEAVQGSLS